ncbi:MAG: MtnX-like HAD-IB family phosphatase [Betaproteobacteria bacterium]|nr:MtnX-like HAD-IB family phosphatase [Betaproteobacteria bacterium]
MYTQTNLPIILCDFDGTISHQDVTDTLLKHFGMDGYLELEEDWKAGKIGSRICMREQIALLDMSPVELDDCLSKIDIDPAFIKFAATAASLGIPLHIVSDGLDYAIHHILQRYRLPSIPVYANRLLYRGEKRWQLEFPYANANCEKGSGHCKCKHVSQRCPQSSSILYVGDSTSDFCVSGKVSHVLAKNKLIAYCLQNGISHTPIRHFDDAQALWPFICDEIFMTEPETVI